MVSVLVVDDNIQIRKAMIGYISMLGFETVQEARNGQEALDICKAALPDIITLDWNMPEMDGLSFLIELRKLSAQPVVIFCSTEDRPANISKVLASGANDYIVKPVSLEMLRASMRQLGLL